MAQILRWIRKRATCGLVPARCRVSVAPVPGGAGASVDRRRRAISLFNRSQAPSGERRNLSWATPVFAGATWLRAIKPSGSSL